MCFCFGFSFLLGGILLLTETIRKAAQEPACLSAHSREIPDVYNPPLTHVSSSLVASNLSRFKRSRYSAFPSEHMLRKDQLELQSVITGLGVVLSQFAVIEAALAFLRSCFRSG